MTEKGKGRVSDEAEEFVMPFRPDAQVFFRRTFFDRK